MIPNSTIQKINRAMKTDIDYEELIAKAAKSNPLANLVTLLDLP